MMGATSSAVNFDCFLSELPGSSVPSPEIPLSVTRGSTTQNLASSTMRRAARFEIFAVTSTVTSVSERSTFVTWPMVTSLYLTKVLPASMPSADLKTMVMVGPSVTIRWTAMPMATAAARIGMIQMTEKRARFGGSTVACGSAPGPVGSGTVALEAPARVPDQARVEGLHRQHGEHHHGHEEDDSGPGFHRHERLELDEGDRERVDEDIEHRPPPDDPDQAIQPRAVAIARDRPALHGDQKVRQRDELAQRDHDAGDQHDQRQRP